MQSILEKTAAEEKVSLEEIKAEIEKAIQIGMANPDPEIQETWSEIPKKAETPTVEELILFLAGQAIQKQLLRCATAI